MVTAVLCSDVLNLEGAGTPGLVMGVMSEPSDVVGPLLVAGGFVDVGGAEDVTEWRGVPVDEIGFDVVLDDFDITEKDFEEDEEMFEDAEDG